MTHPPRISELTWEAPHSTLRLGRPAPGVVALVISGTDVGEHGRAAFDELAKDVQGGAFQLFVDARESRGVTIEVSAEWSRWLGQHRAALLGVHMLTGSRFVLVTAQFVRNYAQLADVMRIYTEPAAFEDELRACISRARQDELARGGS